MLELVKEATGLSEEVIKECKIGFSKESKVFVLPMIAIDDTITGLEIRVPENHKGKFKFCVKQKVIQKILKNVYLKSIPLKKQRKQLFVQDIKTDMQFTSI